LHLIRRKWRLQKKRVFLSDAIFLWVKRFSSSWDERDGKANGSRRLLDDSVRSCDRVLVTVRHTKLLDRQISQCTLSAMHGRIAVNPNAVQYVTYLGAYPAYSMNFRLEIIPLEGLSYTIGRRRRPGALPGYTSYISLTTFLINAPHFLNLRSYEKHVYHIYVYIMCYIFWKYCTFILYFYLY